jgi:DNA-binding protein Fis
MERELAARALAAENGDSAKAAKLLGLTASALQKKLKAK